ncbi:DUF4367 domain-containing protein [Paenibacillus allorhizosphaerae]|uniref:DUF4367 domain-containing protein n=1 Tax=Paenibacillus allorhizosphaerae TaxID=2849866 RepID=A0ABN7TM66_9BACL|nr:DUF4367 domain-containing protein [Paenibacillus allorhizosphaerae]CAG7646681.1 hypothetical protein PAECIP111802_03805 [Paenibacillus allorhizosphaerae]
MSDGQGKHRIESEHDVPIRETVKTIYENLHVPDGEQAWGKLQVRLQTAQRRRKRWKSVRIGSAIAACSILIGLSFGSLSPTSAFKNWFEMVRQTDDGMVNVFFGSTKKADTTGAKTTPPPEYAKAGNGSVPMPIGGPSANGGVVHPEKVTVEEAKKKLDYALQVPAVLPEGYALDRVEIYKDTDGVYRLSDLTYLHASGQMLDISQKKLSSEGTGANTTINQAAGTIKEVDVNGYNAILVLYTVGGSRLEWLVQDVKIEIYGKLGEEEIMKLAKSMK